VIAGSAVEVAAFLCIFGRLHHAGAAIPVMMRVFFGGFIRSLFAQGVLGSTVFRAWRLLCWGFMVGCVHGFTWGNQRRG